MLGSSLRFIMTVLLMLGASAAIHRRSAAGDDCVRTSSCPENDVDGRGCCLKPRAPAQAAEDPRKATAAKHKPVEAPKAPRMDTEAKKAADMKKAAEARKIVILMKQPSSTPADCPTDMVSVPGATFSMGSPPGEGDDDEHPRHPAPLSRYCIDRTEVTVAAYTRCVVAGKCTSVPEPGQEVLTSLCNGTRVDRQDHPVNCIDWAQAVAYCTFASKRLPSEAEWEYAARGREEQIYPWGNDPPGAERLNACGSECSPLKKRLGVEATTMYQDSDKWEATAPVGSFPAGASPFGALDMAGNVAEWTKDWYAGYAGTASHFKDGPHRVIRGGAWTEATASAVRGASRHSHRPDNRPVNVGFRCARGE